MSTLRVNITTISQQDILLDMKETTIISLHGRLPVMHELAAVVEILVPIWQSTPTFPKFSSESHLPPPTPSHPLKMKIVRDFRFEVTKVCFREPSPLSPNPKFRNSRFGHIGQS